jgi:glycosyltransferase involved in cell wall biosynthesis
LSGKKASAGVLSDLITICIPTYRRPSVLMHCLQSCLTQDYRPLEIDISDNSPADDSGALVRSIVPAEGITLRYWRNDPTIGPVENQKKLFASARGRRFVWMNDDDVLLPGAVTALSNAFALAPDVIVSYGLEEIINVAGEVLPEQTTRWNAEYERLSEHTGLRRDLLVCAFWQQISHVGFLILTEAARSVGVRDRTEVGLAADADFAIRLAQAYKGAAHVFIDRMIVQSRIGPSTLSQTSRDVAWKFYDFVAGMDNLSPDEERARNRLLRRIGPLALREHSLAHGRWRALQVFLSPGYPRGDGPARLTYAVGLVAMPTLIYAARRLAGDMIDKSGRLSVPWRQR